MNDKVGLIFSRGVIGAGALALIAGGVVMRHQLSGPNSILFAAGALLLVAVGCCLEVPNGIVIIAAYFRRIPGLIYTGGLILIAGALYALTGGVISFFRYRKIVDSLGSSDSASHVLILASAQLVVALACGFFFLSFLRANARQRRDFLR
jgi:hypothetical protein